MIIFLPKSGKGGGRVPLFGSDGPCAVTSIRTILLLLHTLVFYFMIIRVILLSTHTVNILLPVTTEHLRMFFFCYFVSNQQNDSIMILCGAGDKPILN